MGEVLYMYESLRSPTVGFVLGKAGGRVRAVIGDEEGERPRVEDVVGYLMGCSGLQEGEGRQWRESLEERQVRRRFMVRARTAGE